jgi:serine-protein kinase ATM
VPERVPFRLTRNIVDGMGPCGTEGTFVKVAEETTRILRRNASDLLTILSSVVADPLYRWNRNPMEAQRQQAAVGGEKGQGNNVGEEQNQAALKTITKIKEKLEGYEDSTSGEQQGVEGQVQLLVNSARDPDNLCQMFGGWGPWL